jgi:hypothetical protein
MPPSSVKPGSVDEEPVHTIYVIFVVFGAQEFLRD